MNRLIAAGFVMVLAASHARADNRVGRTDSETAPAPLVETVYVHEHSGETHAIGIGGKPARVIISYGAPCRLFVLDLKTLRPRLHVGGNWVRSLAISPVDDRVALGRAGGAIDIVDPVDGATSVSFPGRGKVNGLAFSSDGRTLVSTHASARIVAWDVEEQQVAVERALPNPGWGSQWSPNGEDVLLAIEKGRLAIWTPKDNEFREVAADVPRGQGAWIRDDRIIRPSALPPGLVVQRADNGRVLKTLGHHMEVRGMANFLDGRFLLTGDSHGVVRLWDLPAGHCCVLGRARGRVANQIAATSDGRFVVVGGKIRRGASSPAAVVWRLPDRLLEDPARFVRDHAEPTANDEDGQIVTENETGEPVEIADRARETVTALKSGPGDQEIAVATSAPSLVIRSQPGRGTPLLCEPPAEAIRHLVVRGKYLAAICGKEVVVWDRKTRRIRHHLELLANNLDMDAAGTMLVVGLHNETVLIDPATGRERRRIPRGTKRHHDFRITPDGTLLLFRNHVRRLELECWSVERGSLVHELSWGRERSTGIGLDFHPDGRRFLCGGTVAGKVDAADLSAEPVEWHGKVHGWAGRFRTEPIVSRLSHDGRYAAVLVETSIPSWRAHGIEVLETSSGRVVASVPDVPKRTPFTFCRNQLVYADSAGQLQTVELAESK